MENLDLSQVAALQQKRTLAFLNHFVITTVQFLNNFMKNCECQLMNFEHKLEKVEASLILLEARLSSIPEVKNIEPESNTKLNLESADSIVDSNKNDKSTEEPALNILDTTNNTQYVEYDRFIKMVQVGVPVDAVKLKISLEGLDPQVLQTLLHK